MQSRFSIIVKAIDDRLRLKVIHVILVLKVKPCTNEPDFRIDLIS